MEKFYEHELKYIIKYLEQFRVAPKSEQDEGFDGHLEWIPDDPIVQHIKKIFVSGYLESDEEIIQTILESLIPSDDARFGILNELLNRNYDDDSVKEALLLAISYGSRPLTELMVSLYDENPFAERTGCTNSHYFPPYMTPLMLASISNDFAIVQCLLSRGHTISMPHFPSCNCDYCERISSAAWNQSRIMDVLRAITSEAFLWLATDDVYLATCSVASDLQKFIQDDKVEFSETLRLLEANVQRFLAKISDMAWRPEEFSTILANDFSCAPTKFQPALSLNMRHFVCSNNFQMAISSRFSREWFDSRSRSLSQNANRLLRCTIFLPFIFCICSFCPKFSNTFEVPVARFIANQFSFILFIGLIVGSAICDQDPLNTILKAYIYFYMAGFTVEKIMQCHRIGQKHFFSFWWRRYDTVMIICYSISLVLYSGRMESLISASYVDVNQVDKAHWPWCEPTLLHGIFYAVACTISIGKIFYFLQLVKNMGGAVRFLLINSFLQTSVGKCFDKVKTYVLIIFIVFFAFSIGINMINSPKQLRNTHRDSIIIIKTTSHSNSVVESDKNVSWSSFGYTTFSSYVTAAGNPGQSMSPEEHDLNEAMLVILRGSSHGIIFISLVNLLMSLLAKKMNETNEDEKMEFKYNRAVIYNEFIPWEMSFPPPFNLIGVPMHYIYRRCRKAENDHTERAVKFNVESNEKANRTGCMIQLFERFVGSKECKYKSIWRTEFDVKMKTRVAYMNPLISSTPQSKVPDQTPADIEK